MSLLEQWWFALLKNNPLQHSLMKKKPEKNEAHEFAFENDTDSYLQIFYHLLILPQMFSNYLRI